LAWKIDRGSSGIVLFGGTMMIGNTITERIGIHKVALCFLEKFGWIEREQYVADQGVDTQVEIVENGSPTGLLYCIQVKTGKSYINKTKDSITYYPTEKHVNYWLNHSLPVLLVICDPESDKMYWDFFTRKKVVKTKNGWKIEIPQKNQLGNDESIDKIKNYYFSNDRFTIVESDIDTSHAFSRTISMKIILKRDTPNVIIESQAPKLIEGLKRSDYYRSEIVENHFQDKPADCVWIWFYRNLEQYKNGLPFCTAFWNDPKSKVPTTLPSYDKKIDDIYIKYSSVEIPEEMVNRRLSKGKYLKIVDRFLSETNRIYENLLRAYTAHQNNGNSLLFKQEILGYRPQFASLLSEEYRQNHAPLECVDLDQIIQIMEATIDNIFIVVSDPKRDEGNVKACVKMYLKNYEEHIGPAEYERKKVT
jgi:hypothetical protein